MGSGTNEERLKDMKPHEELVAGVGIRMIRVVGGWIYWKETVVWPKIEKTEGTSKSVSCALAGVFVPEPK